MYSIIASLLAYAVAAAYLHVRLDEYLEPGPLRKLLVFLLASIVSWAVGAAIDWMFPAQAIHLLARAVTPSAAVIAVKKMSIWC